jgi:ferredoxin
VSANRPCVRVDTLRARQAELSWKNARPAAEVAVYGVLVGGPGSFWGQYITSLHCTRFLCSKDEQSCLPATTTLILDRGRETPIHSPSEAATQLCVDPDDCIDCGVCVPFCTSDAIHPIDDLTEEVKPFAARNPAFFAPRQHALRPV